MSRVGGGAHRKVHCPRLELSLQKGQGGDTPSLSDVERFDPPFVLDTFGQSFEILSLDVAEPPVRDVVDIDLLSISGWG